MIVSDDIDEVAAKQDDISDQYVCDSEVLGTPHTIIDHDDYDILQDLTHLANVAEESFKEDEIEEEIEVNDISQEDPVSYSVEYFSHILHTQDTTSKTKECKVLQTLVDSVVTTDALVTVTHVVTTINSLKAIEKYQQAKLPVHLASNANHEKQLRFRSTKKKKVVKSRWKNSTEEEKEACCQVLEQE